MSVSRRHTIKQINPLLLIVWSAFTVCLSECNLASAQSVGMNPGDFYEHHIAMEREAMPLLHVRENDVLWEMNIWRTIPLREKFNSYMYYPLERNGFHGRQNLAYMIWDAMARDEIPIYQDDEFLIPIDNQAFIARYTKPDTLILEIEDDDESIEYKTVLVPKEFSSEEVLSVKIIESWYLDKQTTGQYIRILGLGLVQDIYKDIDGDREYIGAVTLFWIPMLSPSVRRLLARKEANYEGDNIAHMPSWEYIFHNRLFDSFITRHSNRFNRTISSYLTGEDALLEAERIEDYLLEISMDQWEW